jgi:DNA-binding transcriptional regulator PaaX
MKFTSKKLLMWLYPIGQQQRRRVAYEQVPIIIPEITEEGRLSLIRHLERSDLLFSDRLTEDLHLTISTHGKSQLEADFPVLNQQTEPWQGDWCMIVFLKPPAIDRNFRYLRTVLLKEYCFALERGVYLHAGKLTDKLLDLLEKAYRGCVIIVKYDNLEFGDQLKIIGQKTELRSLIKAYSDIGSQLENMLTKKSKSKRLSNQQKKSIYSVYDRLIRHLEIDHGLISYYFSQVENGLSLLNKLKNHFS